MKVQKRVEPNQLQDELRAAGVPFRYIAAWGTEIPGETDVVDHDENGLWIEPVPEAEPIILAHDASKPQRTAAFETAEDVERMAIIRERSQTDPAFAALADLTLGKQGVTS